MLSIGFVELRVQALAQQSGNLQPVAGSTSSSASRSESAADSLHEASARTPATSSSRPCSSAPRPSRRGGVLLAVTFGQVALDVAILGKVHRWWMSFLPYRSLSALMIPPPRPRGPAWKVSILASPAPQQFRRSRGSPLLPPRSPEGSAFSLHGPRRSRDHKRLTAAVGPCRGTSSRRAKKLRAGAPVVCFSCFAVASTSVARHRARRHTDCLRRHRFFVLAFVSRHPSYHRSSCD